MTTYLSSLLTNTTSRYNNLRRSLLSDESDGDTENDSHISRVLRAYYTEKGRQFPEWLPPDSSKSQAAVAQPNYQQQPPRQQQPSSAAAPKRGGGLSDLWADSPQPQAQTQQAPSLRTGRSTLGAAARPDSYSSSSLQRGAPSGARPLPSQREGSHQSTASIRTDASRGSTSTQGAGSSTQDKLKARLWGASKP